MFDELKGIAKASVKLNTLKEIDEIAKNYHNYTQEERDDAREWLADLINTDCQHEVTSQDIEGSVCDTCYAYTDVYMAQDEDGNYMTEYGEWETRYSLLKKDQLKMLCEKAFDLIRSTL